jgi:exodeoxyribonuclease VII small subunit
MAKHLSFAKAYEELQQITKDFEQEDIDLETSIPKFKRAAELVKLLKSKLTEMETEVEQISLDVTDQQTGQPELPELEEVE